jgi:hypothetical protein
MNAEHPHIVIPGEHRGSDATYIVIPGEHRGSDAREGDPGISTAPNSNTWIPFPRARKRARAGNDKVFDRASIGSAQTKFACGR